MLSGRTGGKTFLTVGGYIEMAGRLRLITLVLPQREGG